MTGVTGMGDDSAIPPAAPRGTIDCLDDDALRAAALGLLAAARRERVLAHLESCATCGARWARFDDAADGLISDLRGGPASDAALDAALDAATEPVRRFVAWVHGTVAGRGDPTLLGDDEPATSVGATALPDRIGRFEIRSVLGQGAFGTVYRAFDPRLDREVAIKSPRAGTMRTSEEREAFLREARVVATINHPNTCQIHEVGEHDGRPYLVMAFVNGSSLTETLKNRDEPFTGPQAALIVRAVALALAAAHAKGIVHRDLKPGNLMFDRDRRDVVVMDFGLARGPQSVDVEGTQTGVVKGTPAYMSPEQARGDAKAIGPASDVFSLGVVFYELLAGVRPFTGASPLDAIASVLRDDPAPPSLHRPGVDPRLEAICLKALAKEPSERYGSMKAMAAAVDRALRSMEREPAGDARPPGSPPAAVPPPMPVPTAAAPPEETSPPSAASVVAALDRRGARRYPGLFPTTRPERAVGSRSPTEGGFRPLVAGLGAAGVLLVALLASLRPSDGPLARAPGATKVESTAPRRPAVAGRLPPPRTVGASSAASTPDATASAASPSSGSSPAGTRDEARAALDEAKTEFEQGLVEYERLVEAHFRERRDAARESGDERIVRNLADERRAFETFGRPPPTAAAGVRERATNAFRGLSDAYSRAVAAYARRGRNDLAEAAAQEFTIVRAEAGFPSIAGVWSEAGGARVVVTQSGHRFTADGVYRHAGEGEIRWRATGRVAKDGAVQAYLVHTRAPRGWSHQIRIGRYSAADGSIRGRARLFGDERAFEWKLTAANLEAAPPVAPPAAGETESIVGARAGERREFTDLSVPFRWCPAGRFRMGSPASDSRAEPDERPQVDVTLSRGFWLGETEATQRHWTSVAGAEPFAGKKYTRLGDDYPATFVSWRDATLFCETLTLRETLAGRLPEGAVFRLPTEAEWEYACRAGSWTSYCFGDDPARLGDYAWYHANAWNSGTTHPLEVGRKEPNRWGLRDVHGNVLEWCRDVYAERLSGGLDPAGPADGDARVLRGGRVYHPDSRLRSANREPDFADHRYDGNGFRVLLAPADE